MLAAHRGGGASQGTPQQAGRPQHACIMTAPDQRLHLATTQSGPCSHSQMPCCRPSTAAAARQSEHLATGHPQGGGDDLHPSPPAVANAHSWEHIAALVVPHMLTARTIGSVRTSHTVTCTTAYRGSTPPPPHHAPLPTGSDAAPFLTCTQRHPGETLRHSEPQQHPNPCAPVASLPGQGGIATRMGPSCNAYRSV